MTYTPTAFRLLISAPGDIREDDIAAVFETVGRWNVIYGQQVGQVVVPTNWKQHSTATFGVRPQEALNEQLVDEVDIVIALFWHRLGSSTGVAESGTVEEIERAHNSGAEVGVLRCRRDIPADDLETNQFDSLNAFFERIRGHALIVEYADEVTLSRHVDAILTRAASASRARLETEVAVARRPADAPKPADVWPRIESRPSSRPGQQQHQLVLTNTGSEPARNVGFRLEPDERAPGSMPIFTAGQADIDILAPYGGEVRYSVVLTLGSAAQVKCSVHWTDSAGEHKNEATLRFF